MCTVPTLAIRSLSYVSKWKQKGVMLSLMSWQRLLLRPKASDTATELIAKISGGIWESEP